MGATGNVTGTHLHLEVATTQTWQYSTFLNPSTILGIANARGTIIHYDGSVPPTPPTPSTSKTINKWAWYMNMKKVRINL